MKRPLRAAALAMLSLGIGVAALPGAARAQVFGGWGGWDNGGTWDGLAPQQVRRAITEHGFRVLSPLRRNGSVFVADVMDQRGQHERLIVAAADAQILQRFLIDDGRGTLPRADDGRGVAARSTDDGLVPPADIPEIGRRSTRPVDRDVPAQRFGDLGTGDDGTDPAIAPDAPLRRSQPPIKTVKPRPRVVERTPDAPTTAHEPGAVESTPLAPAAVPRSAATLPAPAPAPIAKAAPPAAAPPAVMANRPELPVTATVAPAPVTAGRRMADPLAIPGGGDAGAKPARSVASGITGTPAPAVTPAKPGDVPVAPLD